MKFPLLLGIAILGTCLMWWLLRPSALPPPLELQPRFSSPVVSALDQKGACRDAYEALYHDRRLQMVVVFGYKDARPSRFVGDRYERAAVAYHLASRCPKDYHACGFTRDPADGDLFRKQIRGPDGVARWVELKLIHASSGPDDDENRKDSYQQWMSRHAEGEFLRALQSADVVLYDGHSRDGGGPDFTFPRLRADGEPHYWWYTTHKPGLKKMSEALESTDTPPKLVGLFSCVSTGLFGKALASRGKPIARVTSAELLYYADALTNLLGTVSSLAGMWCEETFQNAISAGAKQKKTRLEGFFPRASPK